MKKINIAELLKDCPKGMELDCLMYENVEFDYIEQSPKSKYPIHCLMKTNEGYNALIFTHNGCNDRHPNAKCVIFPKGKTTWEGFVPPCKFKDGDVCYVKTKTLFEYIFIFKVSENYDCTPNYVTLSAYDLYTDISSVCASDSINEIRLATEEEKQKLFDAIKKNGYKWNEETKTLEKLVEPRFKVGDVIQDVGEYKVKITEVNLEDECYGYESMAKGIGGFAFSEQDKWKLAKFDISTLKPFDKVLVRDNNEQFWTCDWFSFYNTKQIYPFSCVGHYVNQCIPYEGNEHLLGTTDDCDEYYKNW